MKKDYKLTKLIRYSGTILIIILGLILIFFNIFQSRNTFLKQSNQISNQILSLKKEHIKNIVMQVVTMINSTKKNSLKKAYKTAQNHVYLAYKIAQNIYNKNKNKLDPKDIINLIVEAIRPIKFNNEKTYFFIVDTKGKVLLNANLPYLEGKNLINLKDDKGALILSDMLKIATTKNEGFYTYHWYKPGDKKIFYKKVSFVKFFRPLNFMIGEGVYPEIILKNVQKDLLKKISAMRFSKEGYIFINKFDGTPLIFEGKFVQKNKKLWEFFKTDFKINEVKNIFNKELTAAQKPKGDFITYQWRKLSDPQKISQKISFIYGVKDWKWIVGAGVYLDDIKNSIHNLNQKLTEELIKSIIFSIILILFIIFVFIYLMKKFSDFLESEVINLSNMFRKAIIEKKEINTKNIRIRELKTLVSYLNKALKEKFETVKKLEKSEEKFRTIFEYSTIPMFLLDKDEFIDCNIAAIKMLKANKKEDLFVHPADLSPEYQPDGSSSIEKAKKIIEELFKTGEAKYFEWTHKRLNGEIFPSYINLCLIPYEDRKIIFVTWFDISELKKLHEEVEQEREKLEVTLKSIGDAVISTDINGKIELMNSIAEKLTGWKLSEAKGKNLTDIFNIINFYTREKVENPVSKVLRTGKIVGLANHTVLVSKDGREYHIADSAAPIKNKNKKVIGVVLVFRDVTEKIKQEKELIKIEKLKSIGILAGGIAHDFNNILTGITMNLSLLKEGLLNKTINIKNIIEKIDKIENSLETATHLTKQLLTFAKGGELIKESVNLNELIKKTVEFHLAGSNIKPIFNFKNMIWRINADKGQLSHVIANLIINAKEAMKNGGNINIILEKIINPTINNKPVIGEFICIKIKDEGSGISKENIEKIFDPFFTTKKEGSGLGLSIIHSIIEKHCGYITVDSQLGKGTTFTVYLPLEKDINSLEKDVSDNTTFDVSQYVKNVLVIDDNKIILETAKELFHFLGVNCVTAENGEEAIKILKEKQFDIIITDLTIPGGLGGKDIIKKLLTIDKNAKVIVCSGYSDDPIMSNYEKYGFVGRLAKPFSLNSIKKELKKIFTEN